MKKILTFLLAVIGLTSACGHSNYENTNVEGFAELIADSSVVILDVRTAAEYADGHIKGAILIARDRATLWRKQKQHYPSTRRLLFIAVVVAVLPILL